MSYTTPIRIKTGTDDFAKLRLESTVFVDKSLLVKEFLDDGGDVVLITRPRRWGKSLNMNMIGRFLGIEVDSQGLPIPPEQSLNRKLFAGGEVVIGHQGGKVKQLTPLKIAQQYPELLEEHLGQYPVITLSLKDVKDVNSYQELKDALQEPIDQLYASHRYLERYTNPDERLLTPSRKAKLERFFAGKLTKTDLQDSIKFLSELLYKHFGKPVYILIDEYDTPINNAFLSLKNKPEEFQKVLKLFRGLLGAAFKGNTYLKQGLITGILRIAKANLFSDLSNTSEYTLLDEPFATAYGFTEEEVMALMEQVPTSTSIDDIRYWYNGYAFGEQDLRLYNPWSIMSCLARNGKLDHYWIDTGGTSLVNAALLSDPVQKALQILVGGGSIVSFITKQIRFEDIDKPIGLYSLLLFSGYLNPSVVDEQKSIYQLSIPNYEVAYIYESRLLEWVSTKLNIDQNVFYELMQQLVTGQIEEFGKQLQELLIVSTSFYQTGPKNAELFYQGFMVMLLTLLSSAYVIESERETGLGRADALVIPKPGRGEQALVIEYKVGKKEEDLGLLAQKGLQQIQEKGYGIHLRVHEHVRSILQVCMAFCGQEVAVKYTRIDL